jgi:hypothetical protein
VPKSWLIRHQWAHAKQGELGPDADTAPRRMEGIHPDRISFMRNTETPMGTAECDGSRPTVRDRQLPSGNRKIREAKAGAPKGTGNP